MLFLYSSFTAALLYISFSVLLDGFNRLIFSFSDSDWTVVKGKLGRPSLPRKTNDNYKAENGVQVFLDLQTVWFDSDLSLDTRDLISNITNTLQNSEITEDEKKYFCSKIFAYAIGCNGQKVCQKRAQLWLV